MTTFAYTAIGRDGRQSSGTLAADTRTAAISQVISQGLHPVVINEKKPGKDSAAARALIVAKPGRVPQKAVESFTRELANLLAGGVPLARAMGLLRREASNPAARYLWTQIHDDVVGGTALAEAMAKFPQTFSSVYVAMVRAGEAGGFLDLVLSQISEFRTREKDLKGKVKGALVYPCMLAILATGVVIFLLTFFIPQFQGIFKQFGSNLPGITQFIIWSSDLLKHYGLFVGAGVIAVGVGLQRAVRTDVGRRRMEQTILATPLLGQVIAYFALVRLAQSYEGDLDRQLRMLVSVAEPLLLFVMAGIVGTIVIGMLLPVFTLQDLIK